MVIKCALQTEHFQHGISSGFIYTAILSGNEYDTDIVDMDNDEYNVERLINFELIVKLLKFILLFLVEPYLHILLFISSGTVKKCTVCK